MINPPVSKVAQHKKFLTFGRPILKALLFVSTSNTILIEKANHFILSALYDSLSVFIRKKFDFQKSLHFIGDKFNIRNHY